MNTERKMLMLAFVSLSCYNGSVLIINMGQNVSLGLVGHDISTSERFGASLETVFLTESRFFGYQNPKNQFQTGPSNSIGREGVQENEDYKLLRK